MNNDDVETIENCPKSLAAWKREVEKLRAQFEAERQRADKTEAKYTEVSGWYAKMKTRMLKAEAEIATLKGDQVPVAWVRISQNGVRNYSSFYPRPRKGNGDAFPLFTAPQNPVVLPVKRQWTSFYHEGDPNHCPAHYRNEGYLLGIFEMKHAIEAAGGTVKDGD